MFVLGTPTMVDGGESVDTTTNTIAATAYEEAMDDVHTRFILNLPDDELKSAPRIFFQLEQAYWFYDDFICDGAAAAAAAAAALAEEAEDEQDGNNNNNNSSKKKKKKKSTTPKKIEEPLPRFKHMKPFSLAMFHLSPLLQPMLPQFETMYEEFSTYKRSISTYGTILLNDDGSKIALCRTWKGKSWTLPGGKVNQGESGLDAAARETYEETGFDPQCERGLCAMLKEQEAEGRLPDGLTELPWKSLQENNTDKLLYTEAESNKRRTCYVCRGVPEDFPFEPVARKEVAEVAWHELTNLPKNTFGLIPFVGQLKGWIKRDNKKKGLLVSGSGTRSGSTPKTPSSQQSANSPRPRGKQPRYDDVDGDDGFVLTPYFNDDGSTPWGDDDVVTPGNASCHGGGHIATPTNNTIKGTNKQRDGSRAKQLQLQQPQRDGSRGKKRSDSRATSRGSSAAAAAAATREVLATDPLVLSALASPGESNRWTENEMFTANEALLGRKITYDGNPHDFAEKGFDISENGRNDPHAFRVVGGTFMNSKEGGALSLPPEAQKLQPLMSRRRSVSTEVSGLSVDAGGVEDGGRMIPFFSDDGKAPWEDCYVDSGGTRSSSRGLPILDDLRHGGSAADNAKDITIVQKALEGSLATLDDLFMTDREITARSQKEKLTILPKKADKSDKTSANNNEQHRVWMKQWVQQLPQSQPTKEFGDFRLDVNAVMNAMDSYLIH
jgi:mRNA-decapping enzyme subunit 2